MTDRIRRVWAREVLDSRGTPTIEAEVETESLVIGAGIAPSGASTGTLEALELRDGDAGRFLGRGVLRAVNGVNGPLNKGLAGIDIADQDSIDRRMIEIDGTEDKSSIGANAILAVSIACARCSATTQGKELYETLHDSDASMPVPFMNVVNGGVHASNGLDIQEFMIVPHGFSAFTDALRAGVETYWHLGNMLAEKGLGTTVGDEGGFAPDLGGPLDVLLLLEKAIGRAGYSVGREISLALDCAATEFHSNGLYRLRHAGRDLSSEEMVGYLVDLADQCPYLVSIEDGLSENDFDGWKLLTARLGSRLDLVGDDLFVTNRKLLQRGVDQKAGNAILVKPNQVGTLTETADVVRLARSSGFSAMMSHRSGETEDTTIADLAVGLGTGKIKAGAPCRTDRTAKYNRLLRIGERLGKPLAPFSRAC